MASCLIVSLIGAPKCGKTTFIKDVCHYLKEKRDFEICMIDADDYLRTYTHVRSILGQYQQRCDGKKIVLILDKNMHEVNERHIFYTLCKSYNASFGEVFFEIAEKTCQERNQADIHSGNVTLADFKSMFNKSRLPTIFQPWENKYIAVELPNNGSNVVWMVIELYRTLSFMEDNLALVNTI
ncbi:unnamed protein product [Brassicogethes aeneus]|uniref:Uncharacterized protein n=1 Tax=Brassicogethes aeneus TaxID=1431903 RepID=A0A9P0BFJ2_BRAAE|nr:unnamed protein product [Brassicogethes aeneus]